MGKQSAILFENKIDLVILKKTKDDNKSSNALTFFLPTSENARNLAMYLKRCLEEKEFTVDLLYSSPDGYKSLYWDGPAHIKYTDEKFTGLHNVREERATAKITLRVYRDQRYGGDMTLVFYFYSTSDMAIVSHLLWTGLGSLWKTIECERKIKTTGDWITCEPSGFCDRKLATLLSRLSDTQKNEVYDVAMSFLSKTESSGEV